ncbi:MAG: hypothetical protein ABWZ66_07045 [Pyrinomonadaceae bacterium]
MKTKLGFLGLFVILGFTLIWGKQLYPVNRETVKTETNDEKILVLQNFWKEALAQGDIEKYITSTPRQFYDDSSRCSGSDINKAEQDNEITLQTKEDGFTRSLRKTAREINEGKFLFVEAEITRYWKDESIINVIFSRKDDLKIKENKYFLLTLIDGKWKIFFATTAPDLLNKEYARSDCSK